MIGPHVIRPTEAALRCARVAPIVKAVDDPRPLLVAPPDAVRVFRTTEGSQEYVDAVTAVNRLEARLQGYRHPKLYLEVPLNEPPAGLAAQAVAYNAVVAAEIHRRGYLAAGPNVSSGAWEEGDWALLRATGYAGLDLLALHAYWSTRGFTPWNALRHRLVHEWLGEGHPPVAILECGRDRVRDGDPSVDGGYVGRPGWRAQGVSADDYLAELLAYAWELWQDRAYVVGATVFTLGPTEDWADFGLDEVADQLVEVIATAPRRGHEYEEEGAMDTISELLAQVQDPAARQLLELLARQQKVTHKALLQAVWGARGDPSKAWREMAIWADALRPGSAVEEAEGRGFDPFA